VTQQKGPRPKTEKNGNGPNWKIKGEEVQEATKVTNSMSRLGAWPRKKKTKKNV